MTAMVYQEIFLSQTDQRLHNISIGVADQPGFNFFFTPPEFLKRS